MVLPMERNQASGLLPVSEASFEALRVANAGLRASNSNLERDNSQETVILEKAEDKLKQIFPVSPDISLLTSLGLVPS